MESFGITKDDIIILFLARIHPLKGPELLVDAFEKISKIHSTSKLSLLLGPDEAGMQSSLITKSGSAKNRVIFTGNVSGHQKTELLNRSNIFILPSFSEGFSISILEALAHGIPSIISAECHFDKAIEKGAAKVAALDSTSISKEIMNLINNKSDCERMLSSMANGTKDMIGEISLINLSLHI